jgi:hypothetical protein
MPCFHPVTAWRSKDVNPDTGKRPMVFNPKMAYQADAPEKLPCGQCVGCRLERSRQWAIRCMHEAQMHEQNCFITLTFSPEALEQRENMWSLDVRDWQLFMKKLRKKYGSGIRFYHCGEYGEKNRRPHYHACIFGFDFPDKELWKVTPTGHRLYISRSLEELWPYGFSTIGDVTFESAAYVARYIMKKINGDKADEHYEWIDDETGEVSPLRPEYTTMSRRPGIGRTWCDRYIDDVYPHDFVVVNGVKMRPPKYYDGVLATVRPYEFDEVKENRLINAEKHVDNNTTDRLKVREQVQLAKLSLLPRNEV